MTKNVRTYRRTLTCTIAALCVLTLGAMLSTPAQAQTVCNSTLIIGFPNGDNLNRVVGQTVRMSLTVTNGPSQDGGFPDNQVFNLIDFFPACTSVSGGVCTPDPGSVAGAPPAISYAGNLATSDCPSLPIADTSNPFDIQFSFAPALDFGDGVGCTFTFDVLVAETGSNGTPANIAQLARTDGVCDSTLTSEAQGTAAITLTCPPCDDGNVCNGLETCNPDTAQCGPGSPLNCNDGNACTADSCDPTSGCVNTPQPPSFCDDGNACTDDVCDPASGCVNTPKPPDFCNDNNVCTTDICVPATGCVNTPQPPSFCDDNNECTDDRCDPISGCVNTPQPPDTCDDDNVCTIDTCDPATGCVNTPQPPDTCDDNNPCTEDICDPVDGCVSTPFDPLPPGCGDAICRTPGFWGTHAGTEKKTGDNITEAVIDCADGNCDDHTANDFLLICGEKIDSPDSNPADGTTDTDDAASSTEAMCVPVKGDSTLQLARQLTAAALNCIVSGGGADCSGTGIYSTAFTDCNAKCASGTATQSELTACISELDCLNNGNTFLNGACSPGAPGNCHERLLVNEDLGLDFDPPGPAGSSNACKAATNSDCTVVGPGEALCDTDSLP